MFTVGHFEIPADDVARAQKFYSQLFNWQIEKIHPTPVDYRTITMSGEKGETGSIGGGLLRRQAPQQQIIIYIDVPSVDEYVEKVAQLGGSVCFTKRAVPGMGYFAICQDTENNGFGLWENNPEAR